MQFLDSSRNIYEPSPTTHDILPLKGFTASSVAEILSSLERKLYIRP